ncbi:hypothetical protein Mth01_48650 [Sphaerimonospora thailandensis]|uniref:Uncharacterized protein n=1 Tax=Sphaerimonospora thailandensis TaxID=795644 RepID=A0A8J3REY6_9ACTN|nr:hypothetical protein Mth01_48650 [Sphaerimonospora thailandensis]
MYGAIEVKRELDRPPTDAELRAASVQEIALRWRTRPAGEIFPATVEYSGLFGRKEPAVRVGIAPEAPCAEALDAEIAEVAIANGCRAVLRASYLDSTRTLVTTIGIAVFPDEATMRKASEALSSQIWHYGVRAAAFPGTLSARFRDAARQHLMTMGSANYLIFIAAGYADGRPKSESGMSGPLMYGNPIASQIGLQLQTEAEPCAVKGVVTC